MTSTFENDGPSVVRLRDLLGHRRGLGKRVVDVGGLLGWKRDDHDVLVGIEVASEDLAGVRRSSGGVGPVLLGELVQSVEVGGAEPHDLYELGHWGLLQDEIRVGSVNVGQRLMAGGAMRAAMLAGSKNSTGESVPAVMLTKASIAG